ANARKEFVQAIVGREELGVVICDPERLPPLEAAYVDFLRMFPRFAETLAVDDMRAREYAHLRHRVCCDYSGFGLFSHLQRVCNSPSSSFRLAYVSANLPTHALYGSSTGSSSLESHVRRKIMDHFRISDTDYCMVFTASKGSAVKLLAESYRFDLHQCLLTSYDHHSQSIEWMIGCAREKGAKVSSVRFRWPSLRICSRELRKQLVEKKVSGRRTVKGLFVFPLQSRVTGARYSYQWIPFAQENHWQVLLDASALGPRDMDALGLSVFRPDFIVSSFYKVFGADPSGFGCLFIKRSAIKCLHNTTRARSVGMVKLLSCPSSQLGEEERPEFPPGLERDALDQTKVLGMINIKNRLRYLISWLLLSLAKLRHPASSSHGFKAPLVQIYGPSGRKYDRGASMAFNLYDWDGLLFQPTLVQRLADRNSISLGLAQIKNVKFVDLVPDFQNISPRKSNAFGSSQSSSPESQQEFLVVTIALSYVSSFEDVYRVWEFVAKFLDADFVNKE
ncbi:hypothetical protein SELMODRAFT_42402, partial [Selaginella moellendorffii]